MARRDGTGPPEGGFAAARGRLRGVALPSEHGGWGLTLEPVVLGLLVAPSAAGACLGVAALLLFLVRTPVRLVLVDRRRERRLARTVTAERVAGAEVCLLVLVVVAAWLAADDAFWVPAAVAAPFAAIELWFGARSRSRRLVPELAGAIAIGSVVAMIVLAGGESGSLAAALWMIVAARAVTSVPFVQAQIHRLHGRPAAVDATVTDVASLGLAGAAVAVDAAVTAGAVAIAGIVVFQRITDRAALPRAVVVGVRQLVAGLVLVAITAAGVALA